MESVQIIERSIITKHRKRIWRKFIKAIETYELVRENDKIMVCLSGGKDSFLLAKCLEELQKHGKFFFNLKFVLMDPGYKKEVLNKIKENAKKLNIDLIIFKSDIFEVVEKIASESPCYMCARMRRGYLYDKARELGCNKIALGHHFDDVIETTLLSMLYSSEFKTMLPKVKSKNFEGIELIRPLYMVKEASIISWVNDNNLNFSSCGCNYENKSKDGKREEIKKIISYLRKINKNFDNNIFISIGNVNLNCILGYKKDKESFSFLDNYDK